MSKMRIAVIGADQLDPDHHSALNALSDSDQISAFALDTPPPPAGLETLAQAVQQDQIDAIIYAGDLAELRVWACFALEQGWPFYSTHPVPLTIEDTVEIRRQEQIAHPAQLQFALTSRLHDAAQVALAKAKSGEYGQLLTMRAVCGAAKDEFSQAPIMGLGASLLDLMHAFAGPFQDVSGFSDLSTTAPGHAPNIFATLRTHSGLVASLHVSTTQWRPTYRLELGFERGYLWLEGLNTQQQSFGHEVLVYARSDDGEVKHETVDRFEESDGAAAALQGFLARLEDPARPNLGTSQQAFDTLNTIQRILAADHVFEPLEERHAS
ncbi:MAG: hypothetical protein AAFO74_08745 [Pseudomonadota bacterium]